MFKTQYGNVPHTAKDNSLLNLQFKHKYKLYHSKGDLSPKCIDM